MGEEVEVGSARFLDREGNPIPDKKEQSSTKNQTKHGFTVLECCKNVKQASKNIPSVSTEERKRILAEERVMDLHMQRSPRFSNMFSNPTNAQPGVVAVE